MIKMANKKLNMKKVRELTPLWLQVPKKLLWNL